MCIQVGDLDRFVQKARTGQATDPGEGQKLLAAIAENARGLGALDRDNPTYGQIEESAALMKLRVEQGEES